MNHLAPVPGDDRWVAGVGSPGHATAVTLTKWFHTEPCTWTETVIWEDIWSAGVEVGERPVTVIKIPPRCGSMPSMSRWCGPVERMFTLLYGNTGGNENSVWSATSSRPRHFVHLRRLPTARARQGSGPSGTWALAWMNRSYHVTVAINPRLPPSTTIEIWDYIYNHVDAEVDATRIRYVTPGGTCEPVTGVDFAWLPISPLTGEDVTFTATPQPPAATLPITYEWSFGDGDSAFGNPVFHAYTVSDTFTVNVTATNACGGPVTMDHDVTVTGTPVTPTYGVELTTATDSASGTPGDRIIFNLTVHNTGDTADTFDLSFTDLRGWTFDVTPPSVSLLPDGITLVAALVDIPPGTPDGARMSPRSRLHHRAIRRWTRAQT